jgi:hypothetical protein
VEFSKLAIDLDFNTGAIKNMISHKKKLNITLALDFIWQA